MPFSDITFKKDLLSQSQKAYIFKDKEILLKDNNTLPLVKDAEELFTKDSFSDCFVDSSPNVFAAELKDAFLPAANCNFITIREYFSIVPEEEGAIAARERAFLNWRKVTRFCSLCKTPLKNSKTENARVCPSCSHIFYPRIEPCIIVLVSRGDEVLLVRHKHRNQDFFTCIAGFMEAGESAEMAVKREVKEEVNLTVKNIRYVTSQGWPYPFQLMLAFYAEYDSGKIRLQEDEILQACWFKKDNLPQNLPKKGSVAYKLINPSGSN